MATAAQKLKDVALVNRKLLSVLQPRRTW